MRSPVKKWAFILTAAILFGHLLAAFHSHDVSASQQRGLDSCAVCLLAHHVKGTDNDTSNRLCSIAFDVRFITVPSEFIRATAVAPSQSPRAPPTDSL